MSPEERGLREAYAALNRKDIAGFTALFDPEVERVEPAGFPNSGTYRGLATVTAQFLEARGSWAEGRCVPERIIVAGDRAVVLVHVRVRLTGATDWIDAHIGDVFVFRAGRVVQFRTFVDERQAFEWAGIAV